MYNKTLIVIGLSAVVLLVLGTLSNVVGYQSVKLSVNDSPLFQIRTQRAMNQQQNILTAQYLGVGKGNLLQFPLKDNQTEQLKKAIDVICKMDDTTYVRFTELCIQKAKQDSKFRNIDSKMMIQALILLRTHSEMIMNCYTVKDNQDLTAAPFDTLCHWTPGCLLIWILSIIGFISITLLLIILFIKDIWYSINAFPMCFSNMI